MRNTQQKMRLVRQIRKEMQVWYDAKPVDERGPIGAYCLWWAFFTCRVLNQAGIKAQLQAGTAYWPRITNEQDDGTVLPQFGYEYTEGPHNINRIVQGGLPEMHCWAADATTQTIIDTTTMFWPDMALRVANLDWPGPKPPSFFWGQTKDIPEGTCYTPDVSAIEIAYGIIKMALSGSNIITINKRG